MSSIVTTREIPGTGVVLKDAPLTNAELDYNFITIIDNEFETCNKSVCKIMSLAVQMNITSNKMYTIFYKGYDL